MANKNPFNTLHKELTEMLEELLPEKVDYSTSQRVYNAFKGVREYVESLEKRIEKLEKQQNDSEDVMDEGLSSER